MVRVYNNNGTFKVKEDGSYEWHRNTQDGHGGMGDEHRAEMAEIANRVAEEKIKSLVPQIAREIYKNSLADVLRGLQYDIDTVVDFAFEDGREIFTSSKTRKAVSKMKKLQALRVTRIDEKLSISR